MAPVGSPPQAVTRVEWGPGRSCLRLGTNLLIGGREAPHFEGLLMWNGVRRDLDMLLSLDLAGGRIQEQGRVFVEPDGTVVRDVTAIYSEGTRSIGDNRTIGAEGGTAKFRQTFKRDGADRILTTLMRHTATGWVPSFPGSDRSVMTRRKPG